MDGKKPVKGRVAAVVSERELVINRGTDHGVTPGMKFGIFLDIGNIPDPDNPENVLGGLRYRKATIRVERVLEKMSVCLLEGRRGDLLFEVLLSQELKDIKVFPKVAEPLIKPEDWKIKVGDAVEEVERGVTEMPSPLLGEWFERHRAAARAGLEKVQKRGFMEVRFTLANSKPGKTPAELLRAAEIALIHTFGWPIGVVLQGEDRPRPVADGIVAEVRSGNGDAYDYWALRVDGDFYLLQTLFEDQRKKEALFFNTRIVRVTETLLYCNRLYTALGLPKEASVLVGVRHGGLRGRILSVAGHDRSLDFERRTTEDEIYTEARATLAEVDSDLVRLVKQLTGPLFVVFDFLELSDRVYTDIVNNFRQGRVS